MIDRIRHHPERPAGAWRGRCRAPALLLRFAQAAIPAALALSFLWAPVPAAADEETRADARGRFREIFCAALGREAVAQPCDQILLRRPGEPPATGDPPGRAPSVAGLSGLFVPGLFSDCLRDTTRDTRTKDHLARFGYHFQTLRVSGTASSAWNAKRIRDAVMDATLDGPARLVVIAHSKGLVDTLEALVTYPELPPRILAVVSLAGAVGGSPLADRMPDALVRITANMPGLECGDGDGSALDSLRPQARRDWLEAHPLPGAVRYYSLLATPAPARVSSGLGFTWKLLGGEDVENDGNLLAPDQLVPGSTLVGKH